MKKLLLTFACELLDEIGEDLEGRHAITLKLVCRILRLLIEGEET